MRISRGGLVLAVLAVIVVGLQISYPLLRGVGRLHVAVLIVCVFAFTCVAHAALTRGVTTAARMLVVTAGLGFAVEVLGVATGVPFGGYEYSTGLGPRVAGVPLVVALAWTMLAWPAAIAARRLVAHPLARIAVGAWALATADLFLDPQLVDAGAWRWLHPSPHLPGVATVPVSNYGGWLVAGLIVSASVQAVLGDARDHDDGLVVALYLWLYVGWVVALSVFLGLPAAAGWGALGMGVVALPLAMDAGRRWAFTRVRASAGRPGSAAAAAPRRSTRPTTPSRRAAAATPETPQRR
jgi:uncharacterized membrane protein